MDDFESIPLCVIEKQLSRDRNERIASINSFILETFFIFYWLSLCAQSYFEKATCVVVGGNNVLRKMVLSEIV